MSGRFSKATCYGILARIPSELSPYPQPLTAMRPTGRKIALNADIVHISFVRCLALSTCTTVVEVVVIENV